MDAAFKDRRRQISEDSEDEYLNLSDGSNHPDDSYKSDSSEHSPKAAGAVRRPAYTPRRFVARRSRGSLRGRGKRYIRKQVLSASAADFNPDDKRLNPGASDFVCPTQVPQAPLFDAAADDFEPAQEW